MINSEQRISTVLAALCTAFLACAAAFVSDLWGKPSPGPSIPLVSDEFTNTATARVSGAETIRTGGDASGMDCYACHDRKAGPPKLTLDKDNNFVLPKEHDDLVMHHGSHNRNNNCYNCHNESNLEMLQTRDARQLKLIDSTPLCGSCHGPTYRDWNAGVHGRTSGLWTHKDGEFTRQACVSCHDPHSPRFPSRKPAPGPHNLR